MLENFKDFLWFLISLFNIALWAKQQKSRKCLFAPQYVLKVFQFRSSQTDYLLHSFWCQFLNKLLSGFQMVYYSLNLVIWEKLPWGVNDLCQVCSQEKLRKTSKKHHIARGLSHFTCWCISRLFAHQLCSCRNAWEPAHRLCFFSLNVAVPRE